MRKSTLLFCLLVLLSSTTAWAQSHIFTLDADFDQGTLVNVNHDAPNNNQLQLNTASGTFPFIWIALSVRCTIAKVDTRTGDILGEYRTIADNVSCNQSSRTTVAIDGSVWVGHRGPGGVTHVGLAELNQCFDRNGNGTIETSTGYGDVLAWPGAAPSNVANAADECILHHADTDSAPYFLGDTRHMSIDAANNLWVGSYNSRRFVRVNGATGMIDAASLKTGFACGGYGGLIDNAGIIWSGNGSSTGLLRWDPNAPDVAGVNPRCVPVPTYGVAIDGNGWIWVTNLSTSLFKVSPDGNTVLGPFAHGSSNAQGLAVDGNGDVWVSSSLFCGGAGCTIGHVKNDGTFVGNVPNPTGAGSTGISVDADGKIWSANLNSHTATRIDPALGPPGADPGATPIGAVDLTVNFPATPGRPLPSPYNYSDMTGAQLFNSTAPQGSWTVTLDGVEAGQNWSSIHWNASTPAGSALTVETRAAETEAGLGSATYMEATNDNPLFASGRYLQVRATLRAAADGTSPILFDLTVNEQGDNACADPATMPSYDGSYVLNTADTRAFVQVMAPQGATSVRFYNTSNLVVGNPETDTETETLIPVESRVGDLFTFAAGSEPMTLYFPISRADPGNSRVAFFLDVIDTCGRSVNVDPAFPLAVISRALTGFALAPAQPNPVATSATIGFSLDAASHVRLVVYDVLGREVARIVDEARPSGEQSAVLETSHLPTGVYVYRLEADGRAISRVLTVAR